MSMEQEIKARARALGFDAVGITDASPIAREDIERLKAWLASGRAARMDYLRRNFEKRTDPRALLEGARSVIVVALNYKPREEEASVPEPDVPFGTVAEYARYDDYHTFMKALLYELAQTIGAMTDDEQQFKVCVDSVPLAERALAVRAGLGFIGKNHMFIHPKLGPQVFLGELVTTFRLRADEPVPGICISCGRCVRTCPTGALEPEGGFDARRCISYLTIEHPGEIDSELAVQVGNRIFGCDQCVSVCPHRHGAPTRANDRLRLHPDRAHLALKRVLEMTPEQFGADFQGLAIYRTGIERLQRNARICMDNAARDGVDGSG
jgi:epoxyqueuosine reductase